MTRTVQELWTEATGSIWPRPGKFTAGEYDFNLQKFDDLIVQACANRVLQNTRINCADLNRIRRDLRDLYAEAGDGTL